MAGKITRLKIDGLHGSRSFDLKIKDNTLILVGENGSGKTTALRIIFYLLSGQINLISKYKFNSISITMDGKNYDITKEDISSSTAHVNVYAKKDIYRSRRIPLPIRQLLISSEDFSMHELERMCEHYGIPISYIMSEIIESKPLSSKETSNEPVKSLLHAIEELNYQILYLPTYRRIEEELHQIARFRDEMDEFKGKQKRFFREREKNKVSIELVEFGMDDVEDSILNVAANLKDFSRTSLNDLTLAYLGDVVDEKYNEINIEDIKKQTEDDIESVLSRVDERILVATQRKKISEKIGMIQDGQDVEQTKLICHYFMKLVDFQKKLREKEKAITQFCDVCNNYMKNKKCQYDPTKSEFHIYDSEKDNVEIKLSDLSSGEKQIVSLFSHIYLSETNKFFVLIDEPELSLSVTWQKQFLIDIHKGDFCSGLIAVTHSPFVYDNELRKYTHGLGEFKV